MLNMILSEKPLKKENGILKNFHQLGLLGRVGLVVAMCVCFYLCFFVCLMSPFHVTFLRGRTGAERASSVNWFDLDLDLNLDLE